MLIAAAVFLYEGEENRVQSVLEDWWVRIDDLGRTAVQRHLALSVAAAKLTERTLNWFLGPKSFSWLAASRTLFSSAALLSFQLFFNGHDRIFLFTGTVSLILCLLPTWISGLACLAVSVAISPASVFFYGVGASFLLGVWSSLILLAGIRYTLQHVVEEPQPGGSLRRAYLLILPAAGGLFYLLLLKVVPHLLSSLLGQFYDALRGGASLLRPFVHAPVRPIFMSEAITSLASSLLAQGKIGDVLFAVQAWFSNEAIIRANVVMCSQVGLLALGLYLFFVAALGLHRLLWPLPNRLLYAIQRTRLLQNRGLVWKVGLALLTAATAPWVSLFEAAGAFF